MNHYAKKVCLLLASLSFFALKPVIAQETELIGEIVYSSGGNIFTMDLASKSISQLTQDGASIYPRWSPDGETIAYISVGDIYLMDSSGSNVRRLTHLGNVLWYPVWSPDGQKIAFVASEPEKTWNIYIVTVDDFQVEQLIEQPVSWSSMYLDSAPDWSPDGKTLVFEMPRDFGAEDFQTIYTIDVQTKNLTQLLTDYPRAANPTWSPDGQLIAYFSDGAQDDFGLFVTDVAGHNRRRIDMFIESFGKPMWSPDSELIAYSAGTNWFFSICLVFVNRDTYFGCFNDGPNAPSVFGFPVWSPDGKYVLFQQFSDKTGAFVGAEPLKVLDVWNGDIYPLGVTSGEYMMDWRPNIPENN